MSLILLMGPPIIIMVALISASYLVTFSTESDSKMASPFECGLDHKSLARSPFSIRFFILAVVFLVFDIETALLMPLPQSSLSPVSTMGLLMFIFILLIGLLHEWREHTLDWSH